MAVLSFLLLSVLMGLLATVYATKCSVDYAWVFECDATITCKRREENENEKRAGQSKRRHKERRKERHKEREKSKGE